jgi:hypothetical protein
VRATPEAGKALGEARSSARGAARSLREKPRFRERSHMLASDVGIGNLEPRPLEIPIILRCAVVDNKERPAPIGLVIMAKGARQVRPRRVRVKQVEVQLRVALEAVCDDKPIRSAGAANAATRLTKVGEVREKWSLLCRKCGTPRGKSSQTDVHPPVSCWNSRTDAAKTNPRRRMSHLDPASMHRPLQIQNVPRLGASWVGEVPLDKSEDAMFSRIVRHWWR